MWQRDFTAIDGALYSLQVVLDKWLKSGRQDGY
jgi:hypothetical protein